MLIGADLFWELIKDGKMRLKNGPFIQNTHLGWIVSGSIPIITNILVRKPATDFLDQVPLSR